MLGLVARSWIEIAPRGVRPSSPVFVQLELAGNPASRCRSPLLRSAARRAARSNVAGENGPQGIRQGRWRPLPRAPTPNRAGLRTDHGRAPHPRLHAKRQSGRRLRVKAQLRDSQHREALRPRARRCRGNALQPNSHRAGLLIGPAEAPPRPPPARDETRQLLPIIERASCVRRLSRPRRAARAGWRRLESPPGSGGQGS